MAPEMYEAGPATPRQWRDISDLVAKMEADAWKHRKPDTPDYDAIQMLEADLEVAYLPKSEQDRLSQHKNFLTGVLAERGLSAGWVSLEWGRVTMVGIDNWQLMAFTANEKHPWGDMRAEYLGKNVVDSWDYYTVTQGDRSIKVFKQSSSWKLNNV